MVDIEADTVMTGTPVACAVRSAERCRVPVSAVGRSPAGTRCTPAATIRVRSFDRMMAPSSFASSRSFCSVNSTFRSNPPEHTCRTRGPSPSTIRAPVRPCRIRSMPARRGVPGAISFR